MNNIVYQNEELKEELFCVNYFSALGSIWLSSEGILSFSWLNIQQQVQRDTDYKYQTKFEQLFLFITQ